MQGKNEYILNNRYKIEGFRGSMELWLQHVVSLSNHMSLTESSLAARNKLVGVTEAHLKALQQSFRVF
jgi:hypothetical protein